MARPKNKDINSSSTIGIVGKGKRKSVYKKYEPKVEASELPEIPPQFQALQDRLTPIQLKLGVWGREFEDGTTRFTLGVLKRVNNKHLMIWCSGTWANPDRLPFDDFFKSETYKEHMAKGFSS